MERIFALYDSDVFYTTRFMEYLKKKKDFDFDIVVFTRKESLEEYVQQHPIEILLLGEHIASEEINDAYAKYIYRLTDTKDAKADGNYAYIFKYQALQTVISEVLADYTGKEDQNTVPAFINGRKITSVFSPVSSLEALLFTWSAAALLAEHKRVLLIMLETFPLRVFDFAGEESQSLSEFIYYIKDQSNLITKMNTLISRYGKLSYLSGAAHGADILTLSKEELQNWINELRLHTDYQEIIFYLGCFSEAMMECMNISDKVLIAGLGTTHEKAVIKEFMKQMERAGVKMQPDKFVRIKLPADDEIEQLPIPVNKVTSFSFWNYAAESLSLFRTTGQ